MLRLSRAVSLFHLMRMNGDNTPVDDVVKNDSGDAFDKRLRDNSLNRKRIRQQLNNHYNMYI